MSREKIYFRIDKGALIPADGYAASVLRRRSFKIGDVVHADVTKIRNPKFNRLVHRIGKLVVANVAGFGDLDAHKAIKRLQLESGAGCEEIGILLPGFGIVTHRTPRSLSFAETDEGEYVEIARAICRHISERYWPELTPEQIEVMAESFVEEV